MKVKGTAVRVLPDFIQENYTAIYEDWLNYLKPESYEIFSKPIFPSDWFEIVDAHSHPTKVLANLLSKSPEDVAFDVGLYSAESALTGIYNIFLKIASLKFTFRRIHDFFKAYYSPIIFELWETGDNFVKFKFGYTTEEENLLYYRNKGWGTKLIELARPDSEPMLTFEIFEYKNDLYYAVFTAKW